jgi:hypothetical protein
LRSTKNADKKVAAGIVIEAERPLHLWCKPSVVVAGQV